MMKENILVLSTSIYIFCNHFQVRERAGYALFHVVCKYQDRSKCSTFIGSVDESKKFEITSNVKEGGGGRGFSRGRYDKIFLA